MLHTRWSAEAWLVVRVEFRRAFTRQIADRERMTLLADLEVFVHDHRAHGGMRATRPSPRRTAID
jgi:hypothetical protein